MGGQNEGVRSKIGGMKRLAEVEMQERREKGLCVCVSNVMKNTAENTSVKTSSSKYCCWKKLRVKRNKVSSNWTVKLYNCRYIVLLGLCPRNP